VGQGGHGKSRVLYFLYGKRKSSVRNTIFEYHRVVAAVKKVEFVSDGASYLVLNGRWYNIIVPNVYAPSEEKSDDSKDSLNEELEQGFDHFPKFHTKIL